MNNRQCVHHWVIDKFNVGRCIKCPAVRDFGALREELMVTPEVELVKLGTIERTTFKAKRIEDRRQRT